MLQEIDEQKWRLVAETLKGIKVSPCPCRSACDPALTDISQPVTNFSQNACKARFEALLDGTAKPTPESVQHPDEGTIERIRARKQQEKQIEADKVSFQARLEEDTLAEANREGNAWNSRQKHTS